MFALSQYPLPYASDALAPYISQETIDFHHGKHLAAYIKNLNELIVGTKYENMPLQEIVKTSVNDTSATKIFNNAAQIYNHDFFFHSMKPNGGGKIPADIANAFGGADKFREQFKSAAAGIFGSGWAWLIHDGYNYKIITTKDADTPIAHGLTPLLTLDVWEHAYYLDYQNRRPDYIDNWIDNIVNWDFVTSEIK